MTDKEKNKKASGVSARIILIAIIAVGTALILVSLIPGISGGGRSAAGNPRGPAQGVPGEGGPQGAAPFDPAAGGPPEIPTVSVQVLTVKKTSLEEYIKTNGDIVSRNSVDVYPDIAGKLVRLRVSLGEAVAKGQVIADVDPSKPGSVYTLNGVRAPIAGTITELPADIGSTVGTQTAVAVVGDLGRLMIRCFIGERYVARVGVGQKASVSLEAYPGVPFSARVAEKSPVLDRASRTLEIRLTVDPPDARIQSGMFAAVKLVTLRRERVLAVPRECLVTSSGATGVFVVGDDNIARAREVKTGMSSDGFVEIVSGLAPGDRVVQRGQNVLADGATVRVAE
ncbi:MAG: efflux RND transporter periplasmic adaptor subunit [Spirochaetales bacterium]|nr:efflux RND transporter periplasmic adaptor subunit [Spirochaetales bacterium]